MVGATTVTNQSRNGSAVKAPIRASVSKNKRGSLTTVQGGLGSKKNSARSLAGHSADKENMKPLSQNVLQTYENLRLLTKNIEKITQEPS
jgi:hypothetical protein